MGLNVFLPEGPNKLGVGSDVRHILTAATKAAIGKERELMGKWKEFLLDGFNFYDALS